MNKKKIFPKTAIISQSNKNGLKEFANEIQNLGIDIFSTGGTASFLKKNNIKVKSISEITNFPEILDGRVKTLHPKIHAGILANHDNSSHNDTLNKFSINQIDLIVVNLYPFLEVKNDTKNEDKIIENIDIGGPTLIRAAAKNFKHKIVIVDDNDYTDVLEEISKSGGVSFETRKNLAYKAFSYVANYDSQISSWLLEKNSAKQFPKYFPIPLKIKNDLKYGENPHQKGAVYTLEGDKKGPLNARIIQGGALSYNNFLDADSAFNLVNEFTNPAVSIIKHSNPCGVSEGDNLVNALINAFNCDPISAFGGIVSFNRKITSKVAKELIKNFLEIVIAPEITIKAIEIFKNKPNLKILETGYQKRKEDNEKSLSIKSINGGFLIQERDEINISQHELPIVTKKTLTKNLIDDMIFASKVAKYVKSNAIVFAKNKTSIGIGAGQMSRIDAAKLASKKAIEIGNYDLKNSVVASDAFLPFPDTLEHIHKSGAIAIIQPGGSKKDSEIIELANKLNISMIFSSVRNFNH